MCKLAVQNYGGVLQFINKDTPGYPELCKLAVQNQYWPLQFIDKSTPGYPEICRLAVQNDGNAIYYVDEGIPDYDELCKIAQANMNKTGKIPVSASPEWFTNKEYDQIVSDFKDFVFYEKREVSLTI